MSNEYHQRNTIVPPLENPSGSNFTWAGIVRNGYNVVAKVWKRICPKCVSEPIEMFVTTGTHVNKKGVEVIDGYYRLACLCGK